VEILYTKNQILEMYLNHIPFGGTAYGIGAAAQKFFGKPAQDLRLEEAALLVGLPQAPTTYSPFTNPEKAKARQFEVLRRMTEDGYISKEEADQAFQVELTFAPPTTDIKAPHFVFYVKSLLEDRFGLQAVERGGLRVITTLDLPLQEAAQASVAAQVDYFENYRVSNGAALVTKPNTGEILAMVGSRDFFNDEVDGKVNLTTRLRQPGSSIKPLNYVTGLQLKNFTPASVILDLPTCFQVFGQPKYCPQNYDTSFHGVTNFRSALASSYNIPAVKVLAKNTLESFIATASAMGITSFQDPSRYGLSLTLGGGEVTMLDMSTAFGTLANQGVRKNLEPFLKISDYQDNLLYEYHPDQTRELLAFFFSDDPESNLLGVERGGLTRVLNREPAYLIDDILADNAARTPVFGPSSKLVVKNHTVSAKTGTTNDHKDAWTLGFTPDYLVTAWLGNNDSTSMSYYVSGVSGAAYIWHDLMSFILRDQPDTVQAKPPGLTGTNICSNSGLYPVDGQPCQNKFELFWQAKLPDGYTATRKGIWVNKDTGIPVFFNLEPDAPPPSTDNLELREHTVISDDFTKDFCLDCPWPQETKPDGSPGKISYPVTTINTITHTTETE
jgi:membrane peptidoglycan carboxypeptidase